jgi:nucleotide-binding universal stress UspA family protein
MLEHVVVPLDGSQLAQTALDYALNLLCTHGKVTLVTVLQQPDVPIYDFYPVTVTPQVKDYETTFSETITRAQDYLKRLADNIHDKYPFEVHTEVEAGDAATMIVEIAEKLHADAIVMSTHGRSGLSRWLFGSVTQKVLAATTCPVFVIPAHPRDEARLAEAEKKQPV